MSKCRICKEEAVEIISFGQMPIANGLISQPSDKEFFYHLRVVFCPVCLMVQLDETVRPEMMFNDNYQFISSTSNVMAKHFESLANEIIDKVSGKKNPFVVELGCNDGIMLKHIASKGIKHLGIEPSGNVAALAKKNGIDVWERFFNEEIASEIVKTKGKADIIYGANVFCHIEDINSVFKGINILLKEDGLLFFEDPYILEIIKKTSFDQIYDEHIYFFSGSSVANLARKHKMRLVDMVPQDVHGGSMRYYIIRKVEDAPSGNVNKFLSEEKELKLHMREGYASFKKNVDKICLDLNNTLRRIRQQGYPIVGYGATAKSSTLLNYAKIGPELIDYICDTTPNKINKYTPGMHIPIKSYDAFVVDKLQYTLLLAWNHRKEIFEKEKTYRKKGGKFIIYFPRVVIE